MKLFKKPNIFTLLIVLAVMGFVFRLVNVITFRANPPADIGMTLPAQAIEETKPEDPAKAEEKKAIEDAVAESNKAPDDKEHSSAPDKKEGGEPIVKQEAVPADAGDETPPPLAMERSFSSSELDVLQSLAKRRDELDAREKKLTENEALLKAAEQEVDKKVAELKKLKSEMETLLGQQKTAEEGRITSLVKIYENMKPKEAARIFDTLDMDILLDVIGRMSERKSSPILASMNPDKARDVTIKLAEQRRLPSAADTSAKKIAEPDPAAVPPPLPPAANP